MVDFNLWDTANDFAATGAANADELLAHGLRLQFGESAALVALAGAVGSCQATGTPPAAPLYALVFGALRALVDGNPELQARAGFCIIRGVTPQPLGRWIAARIQ